MNRGDRRTHQERLNFIVRRLRLQLMVPFDTWATSLGRGDNRYHNLELMEIFNARHGQYVQQEQDLLDQIDGVPFAIRQRGQVPEQVDEVQPDRNGLMWWEDPPGDSDSESDSEDENQDRPAQHPELVDEFQEDRNGLYWWEYPPSDSDSEGDAESDSEDSDEDTDTEIEEEAVPEVEEEPPRPQLSRKRKREDDDDGDDERQGSRRLRL